MIVVLVHILIFGYTKFHQHDVYCTPSTKKLSTALAQQIKHFIMMFLLSSIFVFSTTGTEVSDSAVGIEERLRFLHGIRVSIS